MSFAKALEYEDVPLKVTNKSARKIVKDNKQKSIETMPVSEFVWGKVKQHRFGLLLTASLILNVLFVWQFIANGVN